MFLYHFLWTLCLMPSLAAVWVLKKTRPAGPRGRALAEGADQRFALGLTGLPPLRDTIWIHALSVGEVVSAVPLVEMLRREFPERDIVVTVTTVSGMAVAKENLGSLARTILFMPVDAWWCVRRIVNFVRPSLFILVETDIWPGLLSFLKGRGVRNILVNGRVSPRTFRGYSRLPFLTRRMFAPLHLCLMQSDLDRERLIRVGVEDDRVITVGNIKFDRDFNRPTEEERLGLLSSLGLDPSDQLWVAGSTHPGEEAVLMEVFKRLLLTFPGLRLIVAPRDTGRSGEIAAMADQMGMKAVLRSRISRPAREATGTPAVSPAATDRSGPRPSVVILDTMGELARVYSLGRLSFVGGSLVPVGGHNLIEPAACGRVVLFGPHTSNFVFMSEALLAAGGGWRVEDGNGLYRAVKTLLHNEVLLMEMGKKARTFVENNRGALGRVVGHVRESLGHGR